jgi:hypothetical protein
MVDLFERRPEPAAFGRKVKDEAESQRWQDVGDRIEDFAAGFRPRSLA